MRLHNLQGQVFGRLIVIERQPSTDKRTRWRCRCECGVETIVLGELLKSGRTKSCGCLRRDLGVALGSASRRHGESSNSKSPPSSEYRSWGSMISRCYNPNHRDFKNYGARGITVCDQWRNSFETFLADVGRRPSSKHSIDRIDNDGSYEPENVRWATACQQNRNKRGSFRTIDGVTKPLAEWIEMAPVHRTTYMRRIREGMSERDALFTLPMKRNREPIHSKA